MMRMHRRAVPLFSLALLAVVGHAGLPMATSNADADTCAVPASQIHVGVSENWNARFTAYGDNNANLPGWTGGDAASTAPLPDGRRLWIFSDTFMGDVDATSTASGSGRPFSAPIVSNSAVVEEAETKSLRETLHTGTDTAPRAYIDPGASSPPSWFWPGAGVVQGTKLRLLVNKFHRTGPGPFNFAFDGTAVMSIRLPALTLTRDPATLPVRVLGGVLWNHVLVQPDADYIYGTKNHNLYVAKAPAGDLTKPWTYRTGGGGWSSDPNRAAPIIKDGAGIDTQVVQVNHSFVRLSVRGSSSSFSNVIQAYFSCSPAGPWTTSGTPIYTAPEGDGDGTIIYSSYIHPETVHNGRMLANYSVNAAGDLNYQSMHFYRPRFLRITITGLP